MNSLSMLAATFILTGSPILLLFRLLRARVGEMPRLLLSSLFGFAVFVGGSALVVHSMNASFLREWWSSSLIAAGIWAVLLIVWAADEGRDLAAAERTPPDRWPTGLLGRHWRGEIALWAAFWIVCCWLAPLLVMLSIAVASALSLDLTIDQDTSDIASRVIFAFTLALIGWSLRGLWKSALRRRATSPKGTPGAVLAFGVAGIAAIGLLFLAMVSIVAFAFVAHQLWAPREDEPIAEIRAVRGGQEITIDGIFSSGIARRFGLMLIQAPKARIVHLNSSGGSMEEAYRLAILIRRRELDTYVANKCHSACTLTFAAGRHRWVTDESIIGFHSPVIVMFRSLGVPHTPIQGIITNEYYRKLDVDPHLIARIRETPFDLVLEPPLEELISYKFITGIVDEDNFAASGWMISDWSSAAKLLKKDYPILNEAEKYHPDKFDVIIERMRTEYEIGSSPSEIFSSLRPLVNDIIEMSIDRAADELLRNEIAPRPIVAR